MPGLRCAAFVETPSFKSHYSYPRCPEIYFDSAHFINHVLSQVVAIYHPPDVYWGMSQNKQLLKADFGSNTVQMSRNFGSEQPLTQSVAGYTFSYFVISDHLQLFVIYIRKIQDETLLKYVRSLTIHRGVTSHGGHAPFLYYLFEGLIVQQKTLFFLQ